MTMFDVKTICKLAMKGCGLTLKGVAYLSSILAAMDIVDKINFNSETTYSDAVEAIMESDMFSSAKKEIMEFVTPDKNNDFYKAVIQVVNSDMFSNSKVEVIKNMCNE